MSEAERLTQAEWAILGALRRERDSAQRALDTATEVLVSAYRLVKNDQIGQGGEILRGGEKPPPPEEKPCPPHSP